VCGSSVGNGRNHRECGGRSDSRVCAEGIRQILRKASWLLPRTWGSNRLDGSFSRMASGAHSVPRM